MSSITKPPTRAASPPPTVTRRAPALRVIPIVLGLAGVALATALVAWFGFGRIADALARVGSTGFGLYTAIQAGLFSSRSVSPGTCWCATATARPRRGC